MRKICLTLICTLLVLCSYGYCYAFRSGIYEDRRAYSSDAYDVYVPTKLIENELFNFYSNQKMEIYITKKVKSTTYTEHIKNVIREYYPPPYWKPESINKLIDSAKANNELWIQEKIYLNFRTRTIAVAEEALWTRNDGKDEIIIKLKPEGSFHTDHGYVDMDNSPEYGGIANTSIEFLESIKDIYFDEEKKQEHDLKYIYTRNYDYYEKKLTNQWKRCACVGEPTFYMYFADLYVDIRSLDHVERHLIEGWIKIDFSVEKFKAIVSSKGETEEAKKLSDEMADEGLYYARFDKQTKRLSIIAACEKLQDGSIKKYVLTEPEIWDTSDGSSDVVVSLLHEIEKY